MKMREVCVLGVGMIKFGKFPETSLESLSIPVIIESCGDSSVPIKRFKSLIVEMCLGKLR